MNPTQFASASVTVIIPAYNGEKFIRRALDSVLAQTHAAEQIIVIDDGSKDRTREIVREQYGNAVQIIEQQNGGPARARNAGLREAKGEFIAFLDADDWWEPRKLEEQVKAFRQNPDAVLNYTGIMGHHEDTGQVERLPSPRLSTLRTQLRYCNPTIPPSCVMVRTSTLRELGGFNEKQLGSEDWDLWFRLIREGGFCISPEPLTDYRISSGGLSGNADHMYGDFLRLLDGVLLEDLSGARRTVWRQRILSYQAYKASLTARGAGQKAAEKRYAMQSLAAWPSPFWAPERFRAFAVTLLRS